MSAAPEPCARLDRYTGPYERWVFSPGLGLPYAFPAVRRPASFVAAVLEGGGDPRAMTGPAMTGPALTGSATSGPGTMGPAMTGAEVRLPPLWPAPDALQGPVPFVFRDTGGNAETLTETLAQCLDSVPRGGFTPRVRLTLPVPDSTWPETYDPAGGADHWRAPDAPPPAIIGVIDDGLPFAHRAFLDTAGRTRISHLWLQSGRARTVDRVPFGREIVNGEIDALRTRFGPDERRLYREAGAIDPAIPELGRVLERHASHGAHMLGLAAGNSARVDAPDLDPRIAIIGVQLPNTVAWDTSGFGKEAFMLSALHYIFARAAEIAERTGAGGALPLVVNLSYGWNAGRHDGGSILETAMEGLLTRRRAAQPETAIVLPMGNHFDASMHAQLGAADFADGPARIGWALPPGDRTASYLEIWLPEGFDPEGWQVRVIPPTGSVLSAGDRIAIAPDPSLTGAGDPRRFVPMESAGRIIGQLSADLDRGTRWRVLIALIPTAETGTARRCPSGRWTVEIDPGDGTPPCDLQTVDLWVQRDDDPRPMGSGGRQSRLIGPRVTGFGAMSAIASPRSATRVAGIVGAAFEPARYSGAGLVRNPDTAPVPGGVPPCLSARSEQSRAVGGVRSIGCVSGSGARVVGTSAAAARASRWMVANAAAGRALCDGLVPLETDAEPASVLSRARMGRGRVP